MVKSYRTHSGRVAKIQRHDYPDNWRGLTRNKKQDAGNKCQKCGSSDRLDVHHILPLTRGGTNNTLNLIVLCHACHLKRHSKNKWMH